MISTISPTTGHLRVPFCSLSEPSWSVMAIYRRECLLITTGVWNDSEGKWESPLTQCKCEVTQNCSSYHHPLWLLYCLQYTVDSIVQYTSIVYCSKLVFHTVYCFYTVSSIWVSEIPQRGRGMIVKDCKEKNCCSPGLSFINFSSPYILLSCFYFWLAQINVQRNAWRREFGFLILPCRKQSKKSQRSVSMVAGRPASCSHTPLSIILHCSREVR